MSPHKIGLLALAFAAVPGCRSQESDVAERLTATSAGAVIPVSDLFPAGVTQVCLKSPYQTTGEAPGRTLDESEWALDVHTGSRVESLVHRRSDKLDIMLPHELSGRSPIAAETLDLSSCVPRANGVFVRFDQRDRSYITLATKREERGSL